MFPYSMASGTLNTVKHSYGKITIFEVNGPCSSIFHMSVYWKELASQSPPRIRMASGSARLARANPTARHVASGLKGRRRDRKAPRGGRFVVLCWVYLGFGEKMLQIIYIYTYM
jgi:hypothetical protein